MPFLLVTCPVGAEPVVRAAIAASHGARPAFARPGLLTFKVDAVDPAGPRPHPLARSWGVGLGSGEIPWDALPARPVLRVVAGEAGPPGRVPPSVAARWAEAAAAVGADLADRFGDRVRLGSPEIGAPALDAIVRPDEPPVFVWRVHRADHGPWPLSPPADSPSRAWSKLEELVAWSGARLVAGQQALEVGCSPGGATVALLDRGLRVVGVDPQPMQLPARLAGAPFVHLARPIEAVPREDLPEHVDWLIGDASVAGPVAVRALPRLLRRYRKTLRGVLLTTKLNDWALVDRVPAWLAELEVHGLVPVGAAHLPSFRRDLALAALAPRSA